jgi:hypothetical protein
MLIDAIDPVAKGAKIVLDEERAGAPKNRCHAVLGLRELRGKVVHHEMVFMVHLFQEFPEGVDERSNFQEKPVDHDVKRRVNMVDGKVVSHSGGADRTASLTVSQSSDVKRVVVDKMVVVDNISSKDGLSAVSILDLIKQDDVRSDCVGDVIKVEPDRDKGAYREHEGNFGISSEVGPAVELETWNTKLKTNDPSFANERTNFPWNKVGAVSQEVISSFTKESFHVSSKSHYPLIKSDHATTLDRVELDWSGPRELKLVVGHPVDQIVLATNNESLASVQVENHSNPAKRLKGPGVGEWWVGNSQAGFMSPLKFNMGE